MEVLKQRKRREQIELRVKNFEISLAVVGTLSFLIVTTTIQFKYILNISSPGTHT
jgi:hypothetical protein